MLPVTTTWRDAIEGQFRYPAYLKFNLTLTPPGLRQGTVITGTTESITSASTINDTVLPNVLPVATFEQNRWKCDGSMYLPSTVAAENPDVLWWSNVLAPQATLTFTFDKTYTIPGIFATWDTETQSYPTNFKVEGFDLNGVLIKSYIITSVTSIEGYTACPFADVKKVVLTFNEWSNVGWRARVAEIMFGLVIDFDQKKILKANFTSKSSQLAKELPTCDVSISFRNSDGYFDPMLKDGISPYLAQRQQAEYQIGFETRQGVTEWLPIQQTYVNTFTIPAKEPTVTMDLTNRLAFLTDVYVRGKFSATPQTFQTLALDALQNSNIIKQFDSETPWVLSATLSAFSTRAPAPAVPTNQLLQLIAQATGTVLTVQPIDGFIAFKDGTTASGRTVQKLQEIGDPEIVVSDKLKAIKVGIYTYVASTTSNNVYEGAFNLKGVNKIRVEYKDKRLVATPTVSVSGATLTASELFGYSAVLTITAPTAGANVTINITGYDVSTSITYAEMYSDPTVANGVEIVVENPLVTEYNVAEKISATLQRYYGTRQTFSIPYTGFPELESGDAITVNSRYGSTQLGVESATIDYNGGFSGNIEGVAL